MNSVLTPESEKSESPKNPIRRKLEFTFLFFGGLTRSDPSPSRERIQICGKLSKLEPTHLPHEMSPQCANCKVYEGEMERQCQNLFVVGHTGKWYDRPATPFLTTFCCRCAKEDALEVTIIIMCCETCQAGPTTAKEPTAETPQPTAPLLSPAKAVKKTPRWRGRWPKCPPWGTVSEYVLDDEKSGSVPESEEGAAGPTTPPRLKRACETLLDDLPSPKRPKQFLKFKEEAGSSPASQKGTQERGRCSGTEATH